MFRLDERIRAPRAIFAEKLQKLQRVRASLELLQGVTRFLKQMKKLENVPFPLQPNTIPSSNTNLEEETSDATARDLAPIAATLKEIGKLTFRPDIQGISNRDYIKRT